MARNVASARSVASARTALVYPRNPMGAVYIPGAKSIEGATGDTALTTSGWIENEKYKWYALYVAANSSSEFDTAVTRTGAKTLKMSATDTTGRALGLFEPNSVTLANCLKYLPRIKPSTQYTFSVYAKTTNVPANNTLCSLIQYDVAAVVGTSSDTNTLSGTNDWTLLTKTFTSDADAFFLRLIWRAINTAGNVCDTWLDVNSMTLIETGVVRNPS